MIALYSDKRLSTFQKLKKPLELLKMSASSKANSDAIPCVRGNEILNIGMGSAGVYILNDFILNIMNEHKIDRDGKFTGNWKDNNDKLIMLKHNTFFRNEKKTDRYIPRAIFIDCDNTTTNNVRASPLGTLLTDQSCVDNKNWWGCSMVSYADNVTIWPKGHYTEGAEVIDFAVDIVRTEVERCDMIQGFQFFHSLGGGWGSGFGTLLLLKIRDNYPDRSLFTYSIYPSTTKPIAHCASHHRTFMIYNTILSIHQILENSDFSYIFDNGKVISHAVNKCKLKNPSYDDMNWLYAQVISGCTATLRFHAEPATNTTMWSYGHNFVPFPRLHFFAVSHSPFYPKNVSSFYCENTNGIISDIWSNNDVSNLDLVHGKVLTMTHTYRGNDENALEEMSQYILTLQNKKPDEFLTWIPKINVQSAFVYDGNNHCYDKFTPVICNSIIGSTAMKEIFRRMSAEFAKSYRRKAYLHWYKYEGMDEMEFQEADKNVRDLVTEYDDKQQAYYWLDEEEDEDDDEDLDEDSE